MVSNLVFYQLGLIVVVWLFLILYGPWPSEPTAARPQPPKPLRAAPHTLQRAQTLSGAHSSTLLCGMCTRRRLAPGAAQRPPPTRPFRPTPAPRHDAGAPPPGRHLVPFLPQPGLCLSRLGGLGHPCQWPSMAVPGGSCCVVCHGYFLESLGTPFMGSAPLSTSSCVSACLAEGLASGTARVFEVDPNTVLVGWWRQPSSSTPFRDTSCTTCTSGRSSSMSYLPC